MKYIIYGGEKCKWCSKARELMKDNDLIFEYHDVEKEFDSKKQFFDDFSDKTNHKQTIPVVFVDNEFIGGYTELEKYVNNNEDCFVEDF
jgi:glutaredoxin